MGITARVVGYKSIFAIQFAKGEVVDYSSVVGINRELYRRFAAEMRKKGIMFTPNPMKRCHLCAMHTEKELEEFVHATEDVLKKMRMIIKIF